jgi:hypothetical protein
MKQKLLLVIVAGIALTAGAWTFSSAAPGPQRWQYQFEDDCNQAKANGLGIAGWELVSMDPSSSHRQCIFKRPLP